MDRLIVLLIVLIVYCLIKKKLMFLLILSLILFVELPISSFDSRLFYSGFSFITSNYIKYKHTVRNEPLNQEIAKENLLLFNDSMNKAQIPYWLSEGTALGAVRDKSFIPWDDDTDVSFMYKHYSNFLDNVLPELKANGFVVGGVGHGGNFIVIHRKGEKIDIDIVKKDGDCVAGITRKNNYSRDCNIILKNLGGMRTIDFLGTKFNVPGDDYLSALYSDTWRTPQKIK